MKEISLNILDIAENSCKAGATLTRIELFEDDTTLSVKISDDGCGMTPEILQNVVNPFYTTRTTRSVGLGIPLFKEAAEQTGGSFSITSRDEKSHPDDHGTETAASFFKGHIDCMPLGDIVASVVTLIGGHPDTDFFFCHRREGKTDVTLDTRELRAVLGDVSLAEYEVINWIREYLTEQYNNA